MQKEYAHVIIVSAYELAERLKDKSIKLYISISERPEIEFRATNYKTLFAHMWQDGDNLDSYLAALSLRAKHTDLFENEA